MALKKPIKTDIDFTFPDCYLFIQDLKIDVQKELVYMYIRGYATEEAREKARIDPMSTNCVFKKRFSCSLISLDLNNKISKTNSVKDVILENAYAYLKTLDDFIDSKDIL